MRERDLYKEKKTKKQQSEDYKILHNEIEKLRYQLNKEIIKTGKGINNEEILKLSEKLDDLIAEYLMDEKQE